MPPSVPTATQKDDEVQETPSGGPVPVSSPAPSVLGGDHVVPLRTKAPVPPTPTQNDALGHETAVRMPWVESTCTGLDHAVPLNVEALPELSTATQKDAEAQETASNWPAESMPVKGVHAPAL